MKSTQALAVLLCLYVAMAGAAKTKVGTFSNTQHGVAGTVFILDDTKILIEGFSYDGSVSCLTARTSAFVRLYVLIVLRSQAPDAFFYVGKTGVPSEAGYRVPYPKGTDLILPRHDGEDVTIELQNGWKTSDLK